jgi:hypothetical protein
MGAGEEGNKNTSLPVGFADCSSGIESSGGKTSFQKNSFKAPVLFSSHIPLLDEMLQ